MWYNQGITTVCVLISYFESSLYQTRSVAGHVDCKIGLEIKTKEEEIEEKGLTWTNCPLGRKILQGALE